ncbi:YezD family protein [Thermosinus carboxydivorans]|uniref:YezD family protein n=1 Tax=Thermosinus carboxydivorans TaxID=261685 RepID=UPI0003024FBB|nr:YezD family protein [Thermosinus carboxydivorans]
MDAKTKGVSDFKSGAVRAEILKALSGLQYGQVVIQIKDGKVTQIDRTEKRRLPRLENVDGDGI